MKRIGEPWPVTLTSMTCAGVAAVSSAAPTRAKMSSAASIKAPKCFPERSVRGRGMVRFINERTAQSTKMHRNRSRQPATSPPVARRSFRA